MNINTRLVAEGNGLRAVTQITASCSICSVPFGISQPTSDQLIDNLREQGWTVLGSELICPACLDRHSRTEALLRPEKGGAD